MKNMNFFKWLGPNSPVNHADNSWIPFDNVYIHPCVINSQPYIIYPRGLADNSPGLFRKLKSHYQQLGYSLKEDRRSKSSVHSYRQDRRRWAAIILFTSSLIFESSAFADVEIQIKNSLAINKVVELNLIDNQAVRKKIIDNLGSAKIEHPNDSVDINTKRARSIFNILKQHYNKQESDPAYIVDDFKQISEYYSQFPEIVELFEKLQHKKWQLSYNEDNWVTTASGNFLQVDKAVIHFNTRSAAQLRLNNSCKDNPVCIASPADALLHELLHTHGMLVETKKFLAQGGMNSVLYPYKHEYSVIDAERVLYKTMSRYDGLKRPQRHEHRGRIIKAHCPTCIK